MEEKLIELLDAAPGHANNEVYSFSEIADHLIANGVTIPVRCKECKHWSHMEDGWGDCTNRRFHLDGHADPTMKAEDFCCLGERRENNA